MNEQNLEEDVKRIFFEIFPDLPREDFDWSKHQKNYDNWDSFSQLHLITLTESEFDIEIGIDDAIKITSAKDLLECIKSKL